MLLWMAIWGIVVHTGLGCAVGEYMSTKDFALCASCSKGYYCPDGKTAIACPVNTYNQFVGAGTVLDCLPCPAGTNSTKGSSACIPCSKGNFNPISGNACELCPPGQADRLSDFSQIPQFNYRILHISLLNILISHPVCYCGEYSVTQGSVGCLSCLAGTTSNPQRTSCEPCSLGSFNPNVGGVCQKCPAGTQAPNRLACESCPIGTFANEKTDGCVACLPGSFSESKGASACGLCSPGTWNYKTGSVSENDCVPAPSGTFAPAGSGAYIPCLLGQYNPNPKSKGCLLCPAGTANPQRGSVSISDCKECPAGTYAEEGSHTCSRCPAGSYSSSPGQGSCTLCPEGMMSTAVGATAITSCTTCSFDKLSSASRNSCVSKCRPGEYRMMTGCVQCEEGTSKREIDPKCEACPAGWVASRKGQEICDQCLPGWYAPAGSRNCLPCPPGEFNALRGAGRCQPCPEGKVAPGSNSTSCAYCPSGTLANLERTECLSCPPGNYRLSYIEQCEPCKPGYYKDTSDTSCLPCPPRTYSNETGAGSLLSCLFCPAGTYSTSIGATECSPCPAGSYADRIGSLECIQCPRDQYASSGASSCLPCPVNMHSPQGATECVQCEPSYVNGNVYFDDEGACYIGRCPDDDIQDDQNLRCHSPTSPSWNIYIGVAIGGAVVLILILLIVLKVKGILTADCLCACLRCRCCSNVGIEGGQAERQAAVHPEGQDVLSGKKEDNKKPTTLNPLPIPANVPQAQPAEERNKMPCRICCNQDPNTVLIPCGHLYCSQCAARFSQCPACRQAVSTRQSLRFT